VTATSVARLVACSPGRDKGGCHLFHERSGACVVTQLLGSQPCPVQRCVSYSACVQSLWLCSVRAYGRPRWRRQQHSLKGLLSGGFTFCSGADGMASAGACMHWRACAPGTFRAWGSAHVCAQGQFIVDNEFKSVSQIHGAEHPKEWMDADTLDEEELEFIAALEPPGRARSRWGARACSCGLTLPL
jgi:hypothetical protein